MLSKNEEGYTMIELFVVMALAGLVVGLAYSSYEFATRSFEKWRSNTAFYQEVSLVMTRFQKDVYKAVEIRECRDQRLTLVEPDDMVIEYILTKDQLFRNKKPMLGEEVVMSDYHFEFFGSKKKSLFKKEISCSDIKGLRLSMKLHNGHETFDLNLPLALRQSPKWN